MRRHLIGLLISLLFVSGTALCVAENTHSPFVLVLTSGSCGHCQEWNDQLYSYYQNPETNFDYLELILFDQNGTLINKKALDWGGIKSFPHSIIDGGIDSFSDSNLSALQTALAQSNSRNRPDITATLQASVFGTAKIKLTLTLTNNQESAYGFTYKACITEENSRYLTAENQPYHFGFLDYLEPQSPIVLQAGQSYEHTHYWNGAYIADSQGRNFSILDAENIKIILPIYNTTTGLVDTTQSSYPSITTPYNLDPLSQIDCPHIGVVNQTVQLKGSNSTDLDGNIVSYQWILGDGTTQNTTNITHLYSKAGVYTILLEVTDDEGVQNSSTKQLSIYNNSPPTLSKLTLPSNPTKNEEFQLSINATESHNGTVDFHINWGDESQTEQLFQQPNQPILFNHTYNKAGRYMLSITLSDLAGITNSTHTSLYIDSVVLSYHNTTLGYLIDTDSDGIYDLYSSDDESIQKPVELLSENNYLIDTDDGTTLYSFDAVKGTVEPYQQDGQNPVLFVVFLPLVLFIILLVLRKRK